MASSKTVCCSNQSVSYFWRFALKGKHIADTVDKCVQLLRKNGYLLEGYLEADCEAQIEEVLELAMRGKLEPGRHVKRISSSPIRDMYEMRWQDIAVVSEDRVSGLKDRVSVLLRLYYLEEGGQWVVGLHVHEKWVDGTDEEIKRKQNEEIEKATQTALDNEANNWGVIELDEIRKVGRNSINDYKV
ncbi:hypothetical protein ACQX29_03435 [Corynebacterium diphtheriae]